MSNTSFVSEERKKILDLCKPFRAGELAMLDAFRHIVPCKVLKVIEPGDGMYATGGKLLVEYTEDRGPYRAGEREEARAFDTIPLSHYKLRGYRYKIDSFYKWVSDE